jgi:hypothetical protein
MGDRYPAGIPIVPQAGLAEPTPAGSVSTQGDVSILVYAPS